MSQSDQSKSSTKTKKDKLIEGLEVMKGHFDRKIPDLLKNEDQQVKDSLAEKAEGVNQQWKDTIDRAIEIYQQIPEENITSPSIKHSFEGLNLVLKMAEEDFAKAAINAEITKGTPNAEAAKDTPNAEATKDTPNAEATKGIFAEEANQDIWVKKFAEALENNQDKILEGARKDSIDFTSKVSQKMTDNERSKQLNEVIGNLVDSHPELQKIQDKIQKGASGEQPNFGLKHESYKALYESAQRIQSGTADIQSEVQSMREVINKELPVSRKISSYINKAIDKHMGDENKEATSIKNNENMANVKDTTTVLQEQLAKMEKSGKKLGSSQDPATALQEQLEQTVKNKTITEKDQKKTNTAPEQSHPQPSERDSNSERKTVGNKPKKANLIHTAQQIVSKVTNLIKPAKSDQPDPPPTASKNKTPKNDKGPGI